VQPQPGERRQRQGEDEEVGDDVQNAVALRDGRSQTGPADGPVPEGLDGDALDEVADEDPDATGQDDAEHDAQGCVVCSVQQKAPVEEEDRQLREAKARAVEQEAVE
jgi:hypothetical protein